MSLNPTMFLLLAAAAQMSGQDTVIHIDVNLVQVDAVVTDSANKHVSTLKAGDFVILQDGKPQTITKFLLHRGKPGADWHRNGRSERSR